MIAVSQPADVPFGRALSDLLRESEWTTSTGNPNWSAFAEQLQDHGRESLRKAAAGERHPTPALMEDVARALSISPEHFAEYRLYQAQKRYDIREVGFERALENLAAFARESKRR